VLELLNTALDSLTVLPDTRATLDADFRQAARNLKAKYTSLSIRDKKLVLRDGTVVTPGMLATHTVGGSQSQGLDSMNIG